MTSSGPSLPTKWGRRLLRITAFGAAAERSPVRWEMCKDCSKAREQDFTRIVTMRHACASFIQGSEVGLGSLAESHATRSSLGGENFLPHGQRSHHPRAKHEQSQRNAEQNVPPAEKTCTTRKVLTKFRNRNAHRTEFFHAY
jgi:hypothetical protein